MNVPLAASILAGFSLPMSNGPVPFDAPANGSGTVLVAGICVGTAQDCLAAAIADGELSDEEAGLPYEVFVTFDYNSADLSSEARDELQALALVLNDPLLAGRRFLIEGHTDARGEAAYNQLLSERRAESVRQYLIEAGIDPSRLAAVGFGESRPRVSDPNASQNRRVELLIQP